MKFVRFFNEMNMHDVPAFGGKNASLGQMIQELAGKGVQIPSGFATTAEAYWLHLEQNDLLQKMKTLIRDLPQDYDLAELKKVGSEIRKIIAEAPLPDEVVQEISRAYTELSQYYDQEACDVAIRSSATAEDLPTASFAGQQETFLNITGIDAVLKYSRESMASLFTDRAIVYREEKGFSHFDVALSVGVQKMVRADTGNGSAGVAFTIDPDSGFKDVVTITSAFGLGESVVAGSVNPDEFMVYTPLLHEGYKPIIKRHCGDKATKIIYQDNAEHPLKTIKTTPEERNLFSLSDSDVLKLASYCADIEAHYSQMHDRWSPMDVEWAKDGETGTIFILQARPETIHSQQGEQTTFVEHILEESVKGQDVLTQGAAIGRKIASGVARVMNSIDDVKTFHDGDIIVTDMTDPDWVPLMRKAGAVVTNLGGRTCHAAIVSRELGIPAIIGTDDATENISDGSTITIDCTQGAMGNVYAGTAAYKTVTHDIDTIPEMPVSLMVNLGDPSQAFHASFYPVDGVGLARLEFIISNAIKVHPMAIMEPDSVTSDAVKQEIDDAIIGYKDPEVFFVQTLASAIGRIAAGFYPRPVIVRLSDFKTNEYRDLIGGEFFESSEANPMLGFRGAARYRSDGYSPAFGLECQALKAVRDVMGLTNVKVMVPFVRTVDEAKSAIDELKKHGLERRENGLALYMMVEVPSNVLLIDKFAEHFDGFSIGSNDLTQLVLGVDRDSNVLRDVFDERDPAVKKCFELTIQGAHAKNVPVGICGQAPSDYPEIADFLIEQGIDSLSLNLDSIMPFIMRYKHNK